MKLITAIVNSIGLLFDIAGAILVAIEVVNIFKGEQYKITVGLWGAAPPPEKTKEYEKWEKDKFKYMKLGLSLQRQLPKYIQYIVVQLKKRYSMLCQDS
jgi:hypothetical protein